MSIDRIDGSEPTRRQVVQAATRTAAAATLAVGAGGRQRPAFAAFTDEIRVGLIGCGGRGTGAASQALRAGRGVRLVAMADAFKDRLDGCLGSLSKNSDIGENIAVPPERRFVGLDAYQSLVAIPEINYVIVASPPGFKAQQIRAAVTAGKNVFTEKPMAVDAAGIRTCFEMAELAAHKRLAVGVGLQRHHDPSYLEVIKRLHGGAIGDVVGGRCSFNSGPTWMKPRRPEWSDLEWQMRNWLYFTWLSGDHIVEQHIHNIDVMGWGLRTHPVAAVAVGGRQQRTDPAYGHIYDHFAVDFEYPGEVHVMSMCRQMPDCHHDVSELFTGTKGRARMTEGAAAIVTGRKTWSYQKAKDEVGSYTQEHVDLIQSIRAGKPLNELRSATESNLAAIMGRMAAYTGKRVTWEAALGSTEDLVPRHLSFTTAMKVPPVAIPGSSS